MDKDVEQIVERLRRVGLDDVKPATSQYAGVPLCAIDAVFSIGVRYQSTENVVLRYCSAFNLPVWVPRSSDVPHGQQHSTNEFLSNISGIPPQELAERIFQNRHRTSTKNGILKAEAVVSFCEALRNHGVQFMDEALRRVHDKGLDQSLRRIKGQGSGTSIKYFFMLVGEETLIKPDRMILRFLSDVLQREVNTAQAQTLLTKTVTQLRGSYPLLTARSLDHAIWRHESGRA